MKYTLSQKLDKPTLARFFKDAWNAEVSSDVAANYALFQNVWENIDETPTFEEYEDLERAQLFRYYGYFLSHYGQAKNIPNYQERGKNLLTKAIDLFYSLDLPERALEAEIGLGLCYFYEGAISESETIYEHILSKFDDNQLNPLYLRTKLNSTMLFQWKGEYQKALEIIEEIEVPMEFCSDARLLISYHNQAGLIYRGSNQFDRAVYHYNKCIEISQQENNWLVVGKNHNNLAFLYKNTGDFDLAHYHIEQAIRIFRGLNHTGFLPHIIDTKAVIYIEEGNFAAALETISEAIFAFQKGDDYAGLIDALWNKSKSLFNLNRKEEAVETFAELSQIAQIRIGEYAVKRYSRLFAGIIHVKQNGSLAEEVQRFKKFEIIGALRRSRHNIVKAAKDLGFEDAENLKSLLDQEFPAIYDELGFGQAIVKPEVKINHKEKAAKSDSRDPKRINRIELHDVTFEFSETTEKRFLQSEIKTFYVAAEIMSDLFAIEKDVVLAAAPFKKPIAGEFLLGKRRDNNEYILNSVHHDKSLDIFYLLNNDEPFPLEEINVVGQAVGYCLFDEIDGENLLFKTLPVSRK